MEDVQTLSEQLDSVPLFRGLSAKTIQTIIESCESVELAAETQLIKEGQPSRNFYVLLSGTLGVFYEDEDGAGLLVKVFSAPAAFGEMELFYDLPRMECVSSFTRATVLRIPGDEFLRLLRADGALCYRLLTDVSARLCVSADNERNLAFADVEARLAAMFLGFLEASRVGEFEVYELPFRLTYTTLARCLGVTERSIERTVGTWLKQGWLERKSGKYTFHNLEELQKRAPKQRLLLTSRLGIRPKGR